MGCADMQLTAPECLPGSLVPLVGGTSRPEEARAGGGPAIFQLVAAGHSAARIVIGGENEVLAILLKCADDRLRCSYRAGKRPGE